MLDRMGIGKEGVMIIHGGGIFGDKESAMKRFRENYTNLLSDRIKERLVLENDEICYNADDLLPVCEELNIPMVLGEACPHLKLGSTKTLRRRLSSLEHLPIRNAYSGRAYAPHPCNMAAEVRRNIYRFQTVS